jgi:hypothetical protein
MRKVIAIVNRVMRIIIALLVIIVLISLGTLPIVLLAAWARNLTADASLALTVLGFVVIFIWYVSIPCRYGMVCCCYTIHCVLIRGQIFGDKGDRTKKSLRRD